MRLVAKPNRIGLLALALCAAVAAPGARGTTLPASGPPAEGEGFQGPEASTTRSLRSIEVSPRAEGGDQIVLRLDGEPRFRVFEMENPHRVVVDLEGTVNRARSVTPVSSAALERVRAAQWRTAPVPVARIVMDMNADAGITAHVDGTNLVVDVSDVASGSGQPATARNTVQPKAAAPATPPAPSHANAPAPPANPMPTQAAPAKPASTASTMSASPTHQMPASTASTTTAAKPTMTEKRTMPSAPAVMEGTTDSEPTMTEAPSAPPEPAGMDMAPTGHTVDDVIPQVGALPGAPAGTVRELGPDDPRPVLAGPATPTGGTYEPPVTPAPGAAEPPAGSSVFFETRTIAGEAAHYTGKKISLNLVDADIRQVFRLFHEISGLNFVLDPSVSGRVTIVVDEVPWDQALDLILKNNGLDKVLENNVIRIATTQRLAAEAGSRKALKEAKELEADTVTITRTLSYAKAEDVDQIIKTGVLLSTRGKSFYDKRTNTIIITDVPTKIEPLDKLLTSLDEKTTQVMIEARIVETSREFSQDLGVKWGFHGRRTEATGNPFDWTFPHNATVDWDIDLTPIPDTDMLAFSFGNLSGSFTLNLALDALESEGRLRVLSAPKVATRNNQEAEIEQGVRIPIVNTTATEIAVEFVSASLKLKVTPQITAEGTVLMDIEVSNDTPNTTIETSTGTPGINTQRAKTHVIVTDGGTTVIGGIFVIQESNTEFGIPFFRKIPFFGWLFKNRSITNQNRELLVFVTPKIIKG